MKLLELYEDHKMAIVCATACFVCKVISISEMYIIDRIGLSSSSDSTHFNSTCPINPNYIPGTYSSQYSHFYWNRTTGEVVYKIRKYAPILTYLFAGVFADKYGGQRLMLASLVTSTAVIAVQYLSFLAIPKVFLAMVMLRRFGEGFFRIAWVSLAMQWSRPTGRCTFFGIIVATMEAGRFVGFVIPRLIVYWPLVSYFISCLGFATACWWWIVCNRPEYRFRKTLRRTRFPWRKVFTMKHCYVLISLVISDNLVRFLVVSLFYYLREIVYLNLTPESLTYYTLLFLFRVGSIYSSMYLGLSSDYLFRKKFVTVSTIRKFFLVMTLCTVTVGILFTTLTGCDTTAATVSLILLLFSIGLSNTNVDVVVCDAAPTFPSTLYGMVNFVGDSLSWTATLLLTEHMRPYESSLVLRAWERIFYFAEISLVLTALPYLLCARNEVIDGSRYVRRRSAVDGVRSVESAGTNLDRNTAAPGENEGIVS